jgi:DNA-binding transcriptional ArsR family regulator
MLKNILISKVRIKVLEQFFFNPLEQYHVRGLVRILDEEINAIRRELLNLESAGILKSRKETNKIVFTLNKENVIVEDLREVILKASTLGQRIAKIGTQSGKVDAVVISNSFLTNQYNDDNDIDILFVGDFDLRKLAQNMKDFEAAQSKEYRYAALSLQDFDFGKKKRTPVILNVISNDFVVVAGSVKKLVM